MASSPAQSAQSGVYVDEHQNQKRIGMEMIEQESNGGGVDKPYIVRTRWTILEDEKLHQHVVLNGTKDWKKIADQLSGRTPESCRTRWGNHLNPDIKRTAFNDEEKRCLLQAHARYGNQWKRIASLLPGRTECSVRNHFFALSKKLRNQRPIPRRPVPILPRPPAVCEHGILTARCGFCKMAMAMGGSVHPPPSMVPALSFYWNRPPATSVFRPATLSVPQPPRPKLIDFLGIGLGEGDQEN